MNSLIPIFFILFVKVTIIFPVAGQVFTTVSSGNFYDPTVWDQQTVPGPGSQIVIQHNIFSDEPVTVSSGGSIAIEEQGSLHALEIENSGEIINKGVIFTKKIVNKSSAKFRNAGFVETNFFTNESNALLANAGIITVNTLLTNTGTVASVNIIVVHGDLENLDSLIVFEKGKLGVGDTLLNQPNAFIKLCGTIGLNEDSNGEMVMINNGTIDGCEGGVYAGNASSVVINNGTVLNSAYICLRSGATYTNNNTSTAGDFKPSCCFLLTADAGFDHDVCVGQSTRIGGSPPASNGTEPYTYNWYAEPIGTVIANQSNPVVLPTTRTTYVLTVSDEAGCTATDSVTVTPRSTVFVRTSGRKTICPGGSVDLDVEIVCGSGDYTFQWSPSIGLDDPTKVSPIATPNQSTVYTISVRDNVTGDAYSKSVSVMIAPRPFIEAGPETTIFEGDTIQLYATGGVSYRWSPTTDISNQAIPNPLVSPDVTTTYTVEVTDRFGCIWTQSVTITVEPRPVVEDRVQIFIPQLFSPNGDGVNDVLFVNAMGVQQMNFKVFDRTGKLVFTGEDQTRGWDGKFNGNDLSIDTYAYILEALTIEGEQIIKKGTVQLVR